MEPEKILQLPFVTRDMLSFRGAASYQLRITLQADGTTPISIRGATREGTFVFQATPAASDNSKTTLNFNIPDCPIWVTISDDVAGYSEGGVFARVSLVINGDAIHHLISGYVDSSNWLSWPVATAQRNHPFGELTNLTSANPAANSEISYTVPANVVVKVLGFKAQLVTDGNAATRQVKFVITTGGFVTRRLIAMATQTASLTRLYSAWETSVGQIASDATDIVVPMGSPIILQPADTISTITTNKQAGDDWAALTVFVEQWKQDV